MNQMHLTAVDGIEASQLEASCHACIRTLFSIRLYSRCEMCDLSADTCCMPV